MSELRALGDLSEQDRLLVRTARDASARAYAPYSGYAVGAAAQTQSGHIFSGANLENAAFDSGICAEVAAIASANAAGDLNLQAIAVVGHKFKSPPDSTQIVTPCGRCRQIISEVAQSTGTDVRILSCDGDLKRIAVSKISELLPSAFAPQNLVIDREWRLTLAAQILTLTK
jgi:cytidine deaminase